MVQNRSFSRCFVRGRPDGRVEVNFRTDTTNATLRVAIFKNTHDSKENVGQVPVGEQKEETKKMEKSRDRSFPVAS